MNKNFLKIILAVFVVLAAIASFPIIKENLQKEKMDSPKSVSVDLSGFSEDSVEKITIKKGEDQKTLSFFSGEWKINDETADQEKVKDLFKSFSKMEIRETAAQNEENHAKFEVTREKGIELAIFENGQPQTFFVGKIGPATGEFYIRKEGIKNVYLAKGNLREKLILTADDWKKKEETADDSAPKDTPPEAFAKPEGLGGNSQ